MKHFRPSVSQTPSKRKLQHTITAVYLGPHRHPAVPTSWINTNIHGFELFNKIMVHNRVPVAVSGENLPGFRIVKFQRGD